MSVLCNVRILHPGVIERVLRNDATVCGTANPIAFEKLRNALLMHYHVRDSTAGAIGATQTTLLVNEIVERLRKRIGKQLGGQLPD